MILLHHSVTATVTLTAHRFKLHLRRHSARVHADAPQHVPFVHNGHGFAVFGAVDRAFLAGRTAADHNEVKVLAGPQLAQGLGQQLLVGDQSSAVGPGGSGSAGERARRSCADMAKIGKWMACHIRRTLLSDRTEPKLAAAADGATLGTGTDELEHVT